MPLGPLMVDVQGLSLTAEERERLCHPLVGAVILFARNYDSPQQLTELVQSIHDLREPSLLVAVDHEGGRVQRFREGFTVLPPVRELGHIYDDNHKRAKRLAEAHAWLMATELRVAGVDFSFAPVLDLDYGVSEIIGNRAFHHHPEAVADLAHSYMIGMRDAGMAAVGKHFPGHGAVAVDSHLDLPVDERRYEDIFAEDVLPFERMIHYGLPGIMPAHVLYPNVDPQPAGFSRFWLQEVLRTRLEFQGVIFSDDLSMGGAKIAGGMLERAETALDAGCDMILVCNDPKSVDSVLDGLKPAPNPVSRARLMRLHGRHTPTAAGLADNEDYRQAQRMVMAMASL